MTSISEKFLISTLGAAALTASPLSGAAPETKPNVILILADDLGLGDISFYNKGLTETPNIDRILKNGVNFRCAYSGSAVSAPSRAALLTGMYPHRTGCVTLNMGNYPELVRIKKGIPTIANLFQDAGYMTALIGKWHCGRQEGYYPWDRGFMHTESFSIASGKQQYFQYGIRTRSDETRYTDRYLSDDIGDRSVAFVRENKNRPFFLHLAHYAPHRPLQAPAAFIQKYKDRGFEEKTATVYAMVEILDRNIGKLLKELEEQDILENTIIIFSSDNGQDPLSTSRFNMNLKGTKYTVNEGGIHVPFAVYWKGRLEAAESSETIHFIDVLPTLAELCNITLPTSYDIDGKSFADILNNSTEKRKERVYFWQWNRGVPFYSHNAAIRRGKWKLVRPYVSRDVVLKESMETPVLYNLEEDPMESVDVSSEHPKIYTQLQVLLEQWSRKVEADRLSH